MLTEKDLNSLCKTAKETAIEEGEFIQSQFDQHCKKERKDSCESLASQVVTEVDFKAQEIILQHLEMSIKQFDFGLLTEEADDDSSRLDKAYFWCIDPLDGNLAFTESSSGYSVSIALISKAGDPIIGAVYIPDKMEIYSAIRSKGLQLNEKKFDYST